MCDELVFFAVGTTPTPSPVVTDSPASQFFCSRYYSGAFSCVTDSPASQGQASSPPEPAFALGPVTVPTGSSELPTQHGIMFSDHNQHLIVDPSIALF